MKKLLLLSFLLSMGLCAFAQTVSLDQAIKSSAAEISAALEKDTRVAVLNFSSSSQKMAAYVLDELTTALVNTRHLTMVSRKDLDDIRKEIDFNDSAEVSRDSAQQIGRHLGAKMIVNGSLDLVGGVYRFRVNVLEVETAAVKFSSGVNINNDQLVRALMSDGTEAVSFSAGERFGAAGLNLLFGTGSFLQGDPLGGGITAAAEGVGVVLFIYALAAYNGNDWDSSYEQIRPTMSDPGGRGAKKSIAELDEAYPFFIGIALYAGGAIFGTIRALTFQPSAKVAFYEPSPWNIGLTADSRGKPGLQVSYTLRF